MIMLDAGPPISGHCPEPVEYVEDPIRQTGYKPEHDLTSPAVKERLLGLAEAMPRPEVPNIWHFGFACTLYCDHQLNNGGTSTWDQPEGDGSRPAEAVLLGDFRS